MTDPGRSDASVRATRNALVLMAMRVLMPMCAVMLVFVMSRFLGAPGLGRFTLAYGFLTLFNAVGPLGLNSVITREGARDRAGLGRLLGNALSLCTAIALVLTVAMAGFSTVLRYDAETASAIAILSLAVVPCTIGVLLDGASIAIERADQIAAGLVVEFAVKLGLGIGLLFLGYGLNAVLLMAVIGKAIACMVQGAMLHRSGIRVHWTLERGAVRSLVGLVPTFLAISIFSALYWRIDVFMLSSLRGVADVGYYGAAYRILELAMIYPQSLCLSLYPQIAATVHRDPAYLGPLGRAAGRYLMIVGLPLALCASILASPGLRLLYGAGFEQAAPALGVLIFTLVPYSFVRYHAYVLVSANHQNADLKFNIVMAIVNVTLNFLLIPRYGYLGAAMATLTAIVTYAALQWVFLARWLPGSAAALPLQGSLFLVTALTGGTVWALRSWPLAIPIVAGCLVYVIALVGSGFLDRGELRVLHLDRILQRIGLLKT
jgi:O-antigen/teichoic acid export membrane protein